MAVNNISSSKPAVGLVLAVGFHTFELQKGAYAITYSPVNAKISFTTNAPTSRTYLPFNGVGSFIMHTGGVVGVSTDTNNTQILFNPIAASIASTSVLTLESVTSSGTYTQTGTALKAVVVGGGNAATVPPSGPGSRPGGQGGAGGRVAFQDSIALPGSLPVTIGAGGVYPAGAGGATSFGSLSSSSPASVAGGAGHFPVSYAPPGIPGTPGEASITPTGMLPYISPFGISGGATGTGYGSDNFGRGGGIAAGGGGGSGGWNLGGRGGGGGGGVAGNPGAATPGPANGGNGIVYLLRI